MKGLGVVKLPEHTHSLRHNLPNACCKSLLYLPTKNLRSEAIIVTFQNAVTDIGNLLRVRTARLNSDCHFINFIEIRGRPKHHFSVHNH